MSETVPEKIKALSESAPWLKTASDDPPRSLSMSYEQAERMRDGILKMALALMDEHVWFDVVGHPEDLDYSLRQLRNAIDEASRVLSAPDDEPMSADLYDAICDAVRLDPFKVDIPDRPDCIDEGPYLEDVKWSAGRYRALLETMESGETLRRTVARASWRIRFIEARVALRAADPAPPTGTILPEPTLPSSSPLGLADVAALLEAHPKTVQRWVRSGALPCKRSGHRLVFDRAEVERFQRNRR